MSRTYEQLEPVISALDERINAKAAQIQTNADDISELKEELTDLGFTGTELDSLSYIPGQYVDKTNGKFIIDGTWKRTDYLPVGDYVKLRASATKTGNQYNAFYAEDKTFISAFTVYTSASDISIPSNAYYYILSCANDNVYTVTGSFLTDRDALKKEFNEIETHIKKTRNLFDYSDSFSVTGTKEIPIYLSAGTYTISFEDIVKTHQNKILLGLFDSVTENYVYERIGVEGKAVVITIEHAARKMIVYSNADYALSQGVTTTFTRGQIVEGNVLLPYVPCGTTAVDVEARADSEHTVRYPIPAYWESNLSTVENTVNARKYTRSEHDMRFVFLTDVHWNNNAQKSPQLINKLCHDLDIPFAVFGGDALTRHAQSSYAIDMLDRFYNQFSVPVITCVGNHDNNSDGKSDTSVFVSSEAMYSIMFRPFELFYVTEHSIHYGYYDYVSQKTRYITFDTGTELWYNGSTTTIDQSALTDVFAKVYSLIKDLGEDWSVVLLTHMYFGNGTTANQAVVDTLNAEILAKSYNAKILALFCGHTHLDYNTVHTYNGKSLLVISTMCDAYDPVQNTESGIPMTKGTDSEQAFDIVEIDVGKNKVYCTRVGAGSDREFSIP